MVKINQQNGAVLLISLIILLLITLLGTTAIQTSTLEEKMAGNLYDKNIAFQAAESALREAVTILCPNPIDPDHDHDHCTAVPTIIRPLTDKTVAMCVNGLCPYSTIVTPEFYLNSFDWLTKGILYSGTLSNISPLKAPRYVIEMIAPALSGNTIVTFRITVIAWGVNANTVVKLQTIHKIDYSGSDSVVL
jgi:type IV pilus assembly protein PilX